MRSFLVAAALAVLAACSEPPPDVSVSAALVRTPNEARAVTAGYMVLTNQGGADRLIAAASSDAETVELHTHINDEGLMRMRQVEAVDVPRGETRFAPGGLHLMVFGLQGVDAGDTVDITLDFERGPDQTVTFIVGQPSI